MDGRKIITVPSLSSWLMAVWGVVCLNPLSDMFEKNPILYASMRTLVPSETFWGVLVLASGITGLIFVRNDMSHWTARLMFCVYASFAVLYALADYSQTGCYFFGSIAVANLLIRGGVIWTNGQTD